MKRKNPKNIRKSPNEKRTKNPPSKIKEEVKETEKERKARLKAEKKEEKEADK